MTLSDFGTDISELDACCATKTHEYFPYASSEFRKAINAEILNLSNKNSK
ncbi:MAG: hypothetical protein Q4F97_12730 [Bacteroidales bacterium]|nr:hypothetical protein [Bacteroidales bacterium]